MIHDKLPTTLIVPNWTAISQCSCGDKFFAESDRRQVAEDKADHLLAEHISSHVILENSP